MTVGMLLVGVSLVTLLVGVSWGQGGLPTDVFETTSGELRITFVGHGSLFFTFQGKVIHVDPVSQYGDYTAMPKADLILITHEHRDHLDEKAIGSISKKETVIVGSSAVAEVFREAISMANGDVKEFLGLKVEAVPAYNLVHMRSPGVPYHPKGRGNGYVMTFGDKRVYVAGDTENIPEMKALRDIDIAFLPMNLPYTMTPEMVADAARAFRPKILYPYHYGDTDPQRLVELLKDVQEIEVRVRPMR
jgi:L-ascorbate metabolism protein UlaG (beta-lactamase superfamily)